MILDILTTPHPVLTQASLEVEEVNDDVRELVADLIETMRDANGLGLASPQVGYNLRIAVVEFKKSSESKSKDKDFPLTVLINPVILEHSETTYIDEEGCLSIPGTYGDVSRWEWVKIKALNEKGEEYELTADGLYGRAIQHEMDHLDGILFTEKAKNLRHEEYEIGEEEL